MREDQMTAEEQARKYALHQIPSHCLKSCKKKINKDLGTRKQLSLWEGPCALASKNKWLAACQPPAETRSFAKHGGTQKALWARQE